MDAIQSLVNLLLTGISIALIGYFGWRAFSIYKDSKDNGHKGKDQLENAIGAGIAFGVIVSAAVIVNLFGGIVSDFFNGL